MQEIDRDILQKLEEGLDLVNLQRSAIPVNVLGFGEISSIFAISSMPGIAFKRMPLFRTKSGAEAYARKYREYCNYLVEAGLHLPEDQTVIISIKNRPVVLYIAQTQFDSAQFGHKMLHQLATEKSLQLIENIAGQIENVWEFNRLKGDELHLAIDGQISNWVAGSGDASGQLWYIDTSTPLFRINGAEQMDPELILKSAPSFLRMIIRKLFLADVMDRYYVPALVYTDLVANLYKEQKPELVAPAVDILNKFLPEKNQLTVDGIRSYYKEDKFIWSLFLASRRLDRWIDTRLLRKRYEFLLPGKIKR